MYENGILLIKVQPGLPVQSAGYSLGTGPVANEAEDINNTSFGT